MIAAYKELKKLDPNDLVEPKMCVTTKILNYKQALCHVHDILSLEDRLPDELTQWLADDEARALVRDHAYADAFDKVKHASLHSLIGDARVSLAQSQSNFLELIISNAMNTLEKNNMTRATNKLVSVLKQFEPFAEDYVREVSAPMLELIELLEGGTSALRLVESMCSSKRAPILRAFFYHPNCKLAEHIVRELRLTLAASKETMASSTAYATHFAICERLAKENDIALQKPLGQRILAVKCKQGAIGGVFQKTLNLKDIVKNRLVKLDATLPPLT